MREIAETIGATEGVTAAPLAIAQAAEAMGDFAWQLTRNLVVDASRARHVLGWEPEMPGLLDILERADARAA